MKQPVSGKIYAVSDRHLEINIEQEDGTRVIIQPEHFNSDLMAELLHKQITVYAMGMEAAGLPVLMRATVKFFDWSDAIT